MPYSKDELYRLRSRWSRDLINAIVIALNQGDPVQPLLESVERDDFPVSEKRMDFRGIDFSHQNLRGPWTNEAGKRFRRGVDLRMADFTSADLSWVILPHARLQGALFTDADLSFAELILADLSQCDLQGANLKGAWLLDTKFYNARVTEDQLHSRQNHGQMDFDYHAYEI